MDFNALSLVMKNAGVAGAGGAGFPSYAKLNKAADTIILNCAECEPLLKLHRQVLAFHAEAILDALKTIAEAVEATRVIIAVKPHYKEAVVLGINANFKADTTREKLWESCALAVLPTSETGCDITIYLDGAGDSSDISSVSEDKILRTKMVKTDAGWRLTEFVY